MTITVAKLEGRVALVTGGARGMGEAHARALAAEGARVVIGDVLEEEGAAVAADLGVGARFVRLDVTDEAYSWRAAVTLAEEAFGPMSVLVNNAGVLAVAPIAELAIEEWRRVLDTNLTGAFLGMKTSTRRCERAGGGAIVNVSSMAAYIAVAPASAYTASKWGLRGLTKAAALEFGPDNIRVNSLHPGMIMTPMIEGAADEATQSARYPIPRFGRSEEVATTMLHIVCDATYSTGLGVLRRRREPRRDSRGGLTVRAAVLVELKQPFVVEEIELLDPTPGRVSSAPARRRSARPTASTGAASWARSRRRSSGTRRWARCVEVGADVDARQGRRPRRSSRARSECGLCFYCSAGRPDQCSETFDAQGSGRTSPTARTAQPVSAAGNVGGYAEVMNVTANQVFPLRHRPARRVLLSLLGCGITTGVGSVLQRRRGQARASRRRRSGCGHLGLWMIQARAARRSARTIIAVEPIAWRREMAGRLGATDLVDPSTAIPIEQVRALTGGRGADYVLEAATMTAGPGAGADDVAPRRHDRRSPASSAADATVTYPQVELALQSRRDPQRPERQRPHAPRPAAASSRMIEDGRVTPEPRSSPRATRWTRSTTRSTPPRRSATSPASSSRRTSDAHLPAPHRAAPHASSAAPSTAPVRSAAPGARRVPRARRRGLVRRAQVPGRASPRCRASRAPPSAPTCRSGSGSRGMIGVDVGGTFTDVVSVRDGRIEVTKVPSSATDPAAPVVEGAAAARPRGRAGVQPRQHDGPERGDHAGAAEGRVPDHGGAPGHPRPRTDLAAAGASERHVVAASVRRRGQAARPALPAAWNHRAPAGRRERPRRRSTRTRRAASSRCWRCAVGASRSAC